MGMEVHEFPVDADSDVTSAANYGANNDDLTYLESRENSLKNHDATLDI